MAREVSHNAAVRVFVSYRRADAGGHAGRLVDDLGERLPEATIFQDIESIGPGIDFVAAVKKAITGADAVLVVIGPDWATIAEGDGSTRLMGSDDMVRLEVATALAQRRWVIPVLVGGSAMPDASALPAELAPLAHRNAVTLRPEAWREDLDRLASALDASGEARPGPPAATPAPRPDRRRRRVAPAVAAGALVVVAVAVLAAWRPWAGSGDTDEQLTASGRLPSTVDASGPVELPVPSRTLLHSISGDRLDVEVTSASIVDGREPAVEVMTHIRNLSAYDFAIGGATVRLEADGQLVAPHEFPGAYLTGDTEADVAFTYELAAAPETLVLQVDYLEDVGLIPLLGGTLRQAEAPHLRGDDATVALSTVDYRVGPPSITEYSDRYVVAVPVEVTNHGAYDMNFWSRTFRLLVDGSSQAPVTNLNEVVAGNSVGQATLEWDIPFGIEQLVFRIDDGIGGTADIPLTES
jgi:hypothetical protein